MGFAVGAKKPPIMQPSEIGGQDAPKCYVTQGADREVGQSKEPVISEARLT